jgi:hypothetical protein
MNSFPLGECGVDIVPELPGNSHWGRPRQRSGSL